MINKKLIACALITTLTTAPLIGCVASKGNPNYMGQNSQETTSSSQTPAELDDEGKKVIDDFVRTVNKQSTFSSVTISQTSSDDKTGENGRATTLAKFAMVDDMNTTSAISGKPESESSLSVYILGEDALLQTKDDVYRGTIQEMQLGQYATPAVYINTIMGDAQDNAKCAVEATSSKNGDKTTYSMTISAKKLAELDTTIGALSSSNAALNDVKIEYTFNKDNYLEHITRSMPMSFGTVTYDITLSDWDNTTPDPAPAPNKTYKEMTEDMPRGTTVDTMDEDE